MEPGDVVGGRWRLTGFLGQGGFGQVFKAVDASEVGLGEAALKVLLPYTSDAEQQNFMAEVQKVAQMRHPNLVAYLDSGYHPLPGGRRRAYLVTELCAFTLADYLKQRPGGRLAAPEVADVVRDLAAGLGYLHQRGLLHRDLKSSNILYGMDGWKLGDFGLTRDVTTTGHYHRTGEVVGTPQYMAPELFVAASTSQASDVYALGVLVHQALTGRFPYEGDNTAVLIAQICTQEPALDPSLDSHWRWFVTALLQRDPAGRLAVGQLVSVVPNAVPKPVATPGPRPLPAPPQHAAYVPPVYSAHPPPAPAVLAAGAFPARGGSRPGVAAVGPSMPQMLAGPEVATGRLGPGAGRLALGGVLVLLVLGGLAVAAWKMLRPGGSGNELASLPPEERVVAVAPTPDEGPAGYQYLGETEPSGGDELCVGVEKPAVTYPGVASHGVDFQMRGADGFLDPLFVDVAVHESADTAHQFILAIDGIESACNGRSPADPTGPGQMMRFEDVTVNAPGAEEIAATSWVLIDPAFTIPDLYHIAARVDDLVVSVTGGDLALAEYYTQLVVARAQGEPDPPRVEPSG